MAAQKLEARVKVLLRLLCWCGWHTPGAVQKRMVRGVRGRFVGMERRSYCAVCAQASEWERT